MQRRLLGPIIVGLCCLLLHFGTTAAAAQPDAEEKRRLLVQGLTVYELDREIVRLTEEEKRLNEKLAETASQVEQAAKQVELRQRKTEKVIRSYYSGERNSILLAALHVRSIQDALYVWDQLQFILESDRKSIDDYLQRYQSYKTMKAKLEADRRQLADTRISFTAEKEKRLQAQREVERLLASNSDRIKLEKELEQLRMQWEERGLPLFQRYFTALSAAMVKLPEMLGQNGKMLSIKGLSPKVTIGDDELNRFLQQKNKELEGFSFLFEKGVISAGGNVDSASISLKGRYVVENKPTNAVRFVIDSLSFNGYPMPTSTAKTLERQFDLAFYPNKVAPFVHATDVAIENGSMTIFLKIAL
ncbi:hypothetical protein FE784_10090 [Paenibacillus hemerocallicola]|uniref:SbsC C-terminal domain-containing protein n=1 Tax=Paenibacillus hemerocallicola TaxID=1172614 RepID=A0A5C4TCP3_9BACL|nr:hypothetical protein [Paenibacillus hemerocallicola]TNJ66320.1 hypothetical protein FE784_10090 [Paenibacillus hemerocallicola]